MPSKIVVALIATEYVACGAFLYYLYKKNQVEEAAHQERLLAMKAWRIPRTTLQP